MSVGMLRFGWSSCAVVCVSWLLIAWQTSGQQPPSKTPSGRRVHRQRDSQVPWVATGRAIEQARDAVTGSTRDEGTAAPTVATEVSTDAVIEEPTPRQETLQVSAIEAPDSPADDNPAATSSANDDLTPELIALRDKIRRALAINYPRHQATNENTPWEVMHAIIAYGVDTQLFKGSKGGPAVNAVGWICYNYPLKGEQILFLNGGNLEARRGPGVQGHFGQFLAILAQSHVKIDYPMHVGGKMFTLSDLIEHEKKNCVAGEELTFKLIALMHYIDSDETWKSRDGQEWSIQRLVQEELKQPIRGAACGGTHRLMGFSYAVNKRIQRGKPVIGQFERAQKFIQDYHRYTFSLQNPDGSFSTEWFVRKGNSSDIDRRLKTSGHILEWIGFSLTDEELRDPRMIKAADYLATLLINNDGHKWEIGPLGHGLHALAIYDRRMFKDNQIIWPQDTVAAEAALDASMLEARRPN